MTDIRYIKGCILMDTFVSEIKKYVGNTNDEIVFDIGSKDGCDARYIGNAISISPNNVYAFEAHPIEYQIHAEQNKDIHWINTAIYNYDGMIEFYTKTIGSGIHSIRDRGSEFGTGSIQVCCKKISTLINDDTVKVPTIVKVDVEGCSLEILRSFEKYIGNVKLFHMETEQEKYFKDQHLEDEVFNYLQEHGFVMTMYSTTDGSNQHDSVWVHSSLM